LNNTNFKDVNLACWIKVWPDYVQYHCADI